MCTAEGDIAAGKTLHHSELVVFLCQYLHLGNTGKDNDIIIILVYLVEIQLKHLCYLNGLINVHKCILLLIYMHF